MKKRVAIITHELSLVGGLPSMITFLRNTLLQTGRYEVDLISLATSLSDRASLALAKPRTWVRGAHVEQVFWHDLSFAHFGVWGSELEFQRYRPRRALSEHFANYDLLQFVAGSPPWVCTALNTDRPAFLWTATTTRADRESQMKNGSLGRRGWSSLMIPFAERYERRGLQHAQHVFVLSEYTRRAVSSMIPSHKVTLAPCGVDTNLFRPEPEAARDYLVCVARFSDPRKNVRLLLDAYASLYRQNEHVPDLYLIGDPPSETSRQYLQNLGLEAKVRLIGPKSGEELASLIRNARFFVLSSNEEGLAIVILEAMASGMAVVSTDCGGPATAVTEGETGFLTPVGNVEAFSAAMQKLVSDPVLCQRMGQAGRRVALERFSLAAAGKVFLDKYDEFFESLESKVASQESRVASLESGVESLESKPSSATRTLNSDLTLPTPDSRL